MKGKTQVMKSIKYTYHGNLLYTHFKKHFCPRCGTRVKLGREKKLVNSKSPEAKNYDFSLCDTFLIGDVEFRIRCFYCPSCQISISFEEMEKYEERKKK